MKRSHPRWIPKCLNLERFVEILTRIARSFCGEAANFGGAARCKEHLIIGKRAMDNGNWCVIVTFVENKSNAGCYFLVVLYQSVFVLDG